MQNNPAPSTVEEMVEDVTSAPTTAGRANGPSHSDGVGHCGSASRAGWLAFQSQASEPPTAAAGSWRTPYEEILWAAFANDADAQIEARIKRDKKREEEHLRDAGLMGCHADARGNRPMGVKAPRRRSRHGQITAPTEKISDAKLASQLRVVAVLQDCAAARTAIRKAVDAKRSIPVIRKLTQSALMTMCRCMTREPAAIADITDYVCSAQSFAAQYASERINEQYLMVIAWGFRKSFEVPAAMHLVTDLNNRLDRNDQTSEQTRLRTQALAIHSALLSEPDETDKQINSAREAWRIAPKGDKALCRVLIRHYRVILRRRHKSPDRIAAAELMESFYADGKNTSDWFMDWLDKILSDAS